MSRALKKSPGSFIDPEKKGSTEDPESQEQLDVVKENENSNRSRGNEEEEDSTEIPDLPRYVPQVKEKEETTEIRIQEPIPVYSPEVAPIVKDKEEITKIDPTESPTQDVLPVYAPEEGAPTIEDAEIDPTEIYPSKEELLSLNSPDQAPSFEDPQGEVNLTTEALPIYYNDRVSITSQCKYRQLFFNADVHVQCH